MNVNGTKNKAISYQCTKCDYFEFDLNSSKKVVEEFVNENESSSLYDAKEWTKLKINSMKKW